MDKANIISIIVGIVFFIVIIDQVKLLKDTVVFAKKSMSEIVVSILGYVIIIAITVIYGNSIYDYMLGIIGGIIIPIMTIKTGISSKGINFISRGKGFATWDKLKDVRVYLKDDINIKFVANGYDSDLCFRYKEYEKVMKLLLEYLSESDVKVIK
ncbi:hypothetical protein CBC_A0988 [Clostridium botulinum C str. Eklund]|nr:hypothetical protein CBC_A0988 [Clostridium botulinum C str. Eklund]NEZ50210.1 hypothetical protein [Clostridium botulinum]